MAAENMILLFDESGTPTINDDKRTDWFLGVSVVYTQSDEELIFSECEVAVGLAKSKPLKNSAIGDSRALDILKLLVELPVTIYVSSVNVADPNLRKIIVDYERFCEKGRREFRQVRKRPIAQIIHSNVLDHCLFNSIVGHFESGGGDAAFEVFTDDWAIPENDVKISLENRSLSLYEQIMPLCANLKLGRLESIAPLKLLDSDSHRKRFVDVVTSVFSRAYLRPHDSRYSRNSIDMFDGSGRAHHSDATQHFTDIMIEVMNRVPGVGV